MDQEDNKILEITKLEDGRNQIIFRKSALKGKVTSSDVMNVILIAARMQAEKFVEKLSRGAPLDPGEIKSLKELAEITKIELSQPVQSTQMIQTTNMDEIKQKLYQALTEKVKS